MFRDSAVSHKVVSSLNLRCCTFFSIIPYQRSVLGWASVLTCLCFSHRSCALSFLKAASGQWGQQAEALPVPLKDPASQRLRNVAPPPPRRSTPLLRAWEKLRSEPAGKQTDAFWSYERAPVQRRTFAAPALASCSHAELLNESWRTAASALVPESVGELMAETFPALPQPPTPLFLKNTTNH